MPWKHPEALLKHRLLGATLRFFDSMIEPEICICKMFSGDADIADLGATI